MENMQTVTRKVNQQIPNFSGEQRKAAIRAAQKELERASELLEDMNQESRAAPPQYRNKLSGKVSNYERDLQRLKADLAATASGTYSAPSGRTELLGSSGGGNTGGAGTYGSGDYANNQRQRVLDANQMLHSSSDRLQNIRRTGEESEAMGQNILSDLHTQRETIIRTGGYLSQTDADLGKSRRVLNSIGRRIVTNKIILMLIIAVLIGILGMTIYLKLKH